MSDLHAVHGRIVDLRRYVNIHLSRRLPFVPSERYELWLRLKSGGERQFTIQTRTMPARRGHEVSLIVTDTQPPNVLGLANWSILDGANYIRTDPPSLLRPWDALAVPGLFVVLMAGWQKAGAALSVPVIVIYLLVAMLLRAREPGLAGPPRWTSRSIGRRGAPAGHRSNACTDPSRTACRAGWAGSRAAYGAFSSRARQATNSSMVRSGRSCCSA